MALTVCKECGGQVSKSVSVCPHCGAPRKRKTSRLTWLILILLALIIIASIGGSDEPTQKRTSSDKETAVEKDVTEESQSDAVKTVKPSWKVRVSEDEMSGDKTVYAISPSTTSIKRMSFPYTGTQAWLGYGCSSDSEWLYVGFSEAPNLTNTEAKTGGYSTFSNRVRWDSELDRESFSQEWGDKFIHFEDKVNSIRKVMSSETVRLELNWHGNGQVHFDFTLDGSKASISEAREVCGL